MIVGAFDEGPGIGLGHRRRVEGIQRELAGFGIGCELREIASAPVEGDIVLVDSYRVRGDDRSRIVANQVIAIDDLERDLDVDLVIDPDPGADERVHERAHEVLAGATYAIVDAGLRSFAVMPARQTVRRVLVTTGAADDEGIGARLACELADALPDARIRLVVGPWGRGTDDPRVDIVVAPQGLAAELAAADLVVTAGGVSMLEACCLGRPTVAFSIGEGQGRALAGAALVGAVLAADRATAAGIAARLAGDYGARRRLSGSARALIDGQGALRAAAVIASMSRHGIHAR